MAAKRLAIVGTAPSWTLTPWTDPGLVIASLNDAYRMKGFVRADLWFDTHPLDKFVSVPPGQDRVWAHQVPPGHYVRPADHLDWLARQAQTIPVVLHPEYLQQHPAAAAWPKAQAFPKTQAEDHFGEYWTSSPAWIIGWGLLHGCRDFEIYGIHLSTEQEYIDQRPCFEFFCGMVLGSSRRTMTVANGIRHYCSMDGSIKLPEASPLLRADFKYGYDVRPMTRLEPLRWDLHRFSVKKERALTELRRAKWWQRRKPIQEHLLDLDAEIFDTHQRMGQMKLAAELAAAK